MMRFLKFLCAALSAFLLWAAFPPQDEGYNILFALVPLLTLTRLTPPKESAKWWFLGGFAFWFATLAWMPAVCKNGGPWPLVVLGWGGLAAVCAGYFALFGYLAARLWQRGPSLMALIGEAVLWAGIEWLRGTLFSGFAWNFLGTAIGAWPACIAPARLGGVYLVSALIVLVNGMITTLLVRTLRPQPKVPRLIRFLETALPLALIALALHFAGKAAYTGPVRSLRVALVQRNAPCCFSERNARDPYLPFINLIDKVALAQPDLIVFAESAFEEFGQARDGRTCQAAVHFANRASATAVIGGATDVIYTNGVRAVYNAAACYSPNVSNALLAVYHKQHLVPFGEYIPLDKWITPLQKLSPIGESLMPGEPLLFDLDGFKAAPLICFEDTVPPLARTAAQMGAAFLVIMTNDSWFSGSNEAEQHARQAILRAVETGLPVVRVGNSGVTGVITPSGRARWLSDGAGRVLVDQSGCQVESIVLTPQPPLTPYVRFGDWPLLILFALTLVQAFIPYPQQNKTTL